MINVSGRGERINCQLHGWVAPLSWTIHNELLACPLENLIPAGKTICKAAIKQTYHLLDLRF
jgi:hypothetical protein